MNRNRKPILVVLLTIMLALLATATVAAQTVTYRTSLSGSEEVPPVETDARGRFEIMFREDGSAARFTLDVIRIEDVIFAHIHCAPAGVNGPVGVTLFHGGPVTPNGTLASARITAPDEGNSCGWETLADVIAAIEAGNAYVNVHTVAHPGGEVRGQL